MRKNIFERMGVPHIETEDAARKQRVFTAGHVFHNWLQELTKKAGVSVAQEIELIDNDLMIKGHFDDLVLIDGKLILYDYKTVNSRSFMWAKKNGNAMSLYHHMQIGTYMYMLRQKGEIEVGRITIPMVTVEGNKAPDMVKPGEVYQTNKLSEARILKIEKENLMMMEQQLMWSPELEKEVVGYWRTLNGYWKAKKLPKCTCADHEGGFMAKPAYNPYFYNDEPCSLEWFKLCKEAGTVKAYQENNDAIL